MNDKELLKYILSLLRQATSTLDNKEEFINKIIEALKSRVGNIKQGEVNKNLADPLFVNKILKVFNNLINKGYNDEQIYPYLRKEYGIGRDDYNYLLSRYQQETNHYKDNRSFNQLYTQVLKVYNRFDTLDEKQLNKFFINLLNKFEPGSTDVQLTDEQDYETESVRTESVAKGDIFQYKGELYAVDRVQKGLLRLIELYSNSPIRLNTENLNKIDILTEKSIQQVLDSFIEEKAVDKLPNIIQTQYQDYINKKTMNIKSIKAKLDKIALDDYDDLLYRIQRLIHRNLRRFIVDVNDYDNFENECNRVAQLIFDEIKFNK